MKKLLALVLALVMTLSLCVVSSNAAYKDAANVDFDEAVEVMSAVGVFQGSDGKFDPKANLTREQAAKLVAYLDLGEKVAETLPATKVFNDVAADRWSAKYVAYCADAGYLAGVGNGNFDPTGTLTGYAFGKMLLCALGYDAAAEGFTGTGWAIAVAKLMNTNDIAKGVDTALSATLTREQAAQYCLNTLKATCVEYTGGTNITIGNTTIKQGATRVELLGKTSVGATDLEDAINNTTSGGKDLVQLGEKLYGGKLVLKTTGVNAYGVPSNTWYYNAKLGSAATTFTTNTDDVVIKAAKTASYTFVIAKDVKKTNLQTTLRKLADDDYLTVTGDVYINGDKDDNGSAANGTAYNAASVFALCDKVGTVINLYATTTADAYNVVAYQYKLDKITKVNTDVSDADAKKGVSCYVDFDKHADGVKDTDIPGFDASTYVKGAYINYVVGLQGEIVTSAIASKVTGKVSETKDDTYAILDGTKYTVNANYKAGTFNKDIDTDVKASADAEYDFYLDANGYVTGIDVVKAAAATMDEVFYVDNVYTKTTNVGGNASVTTYHAQLVNVADGTVSNIELENADKNDTDDVYDSTYDGALVTLSDKKWTDAASKTHKAADDKFDLTVYAPTTGYAKNAVAAYATGGGGAQTAGVTADLTKSMTRFTDKAGNTYRVNSETKYVFITGTKDTIDTKVYTGGIAYDNAQMGASYVITTRNSSDTDTKVAAYVVIKGNSTTMSQTYSKDAIFVVSDSSEKGDGYRNQTIYKADGTKETWKVAESEYAKGVGFYTYDTNTDGYYVLTGATAMTIGSDMVWDENEGAIVNATIAANALFENLLTVTKTHKVEDIDVTNAAFVDAHDVDANGNYTKTVSSLADLCDLKDDGKVGTVTLSMNVAESGAVIIVVTDIDVAP